MPDEPMSSSGRGTGVVGYNVQVAVDTDNHIIVTHEVTNVGTDRAQFSGMATKAKAALGVEQLDLVADRGYFSGEQILASQQATPAAAIRDAFSASSWPGQA